MFNLSNKKCPVCKMELKEGKNYPESSGKKFCSEKCKEDYQKQLVKEQLKRASGGCCD